MSVPWKIEVIARFPFKTLQSRTIVSDADEGRFGGGPLGEIGRAGCHSCNQLSSRVQSNILKYLPEHLSSRLCRKTCLNRVPDSLLSLVCLTLSSHVFTVYTSYSVSSILIHSHQFPSILEHSYWSGCSQSPTDFRHFDLAVQVRLEPSGETP